MARNITDTEWQILNILTCNRCNPKTSDMTLLQAHHCKPRNQQVTAGVSYNLVNAKFTCSLCTVELPESEFSEHLEGHLTLKPYVCKYCDRDFSTRGDVCEHLRSFHQQDEEIFLLKLTGKTKNIVGKARDFGKVFYKAVNLLVPIPDNAAVVISKTSAQNLTTAAGQNQKKMKAQMASCSHLGPTSTVHSTLPKAIPPVSLGAHHHLASQLNFDIVLTSPRLHLPAKQKRCSVVLTTHSQTGTVSTTVLSNLMNNTSASAAVMTNTHKAIPKVSPSPMKQSLEPAVTASTEGNNPLMPAGMSINCQNPTINDAGNMCKVSIQQFPKEVKSSVESDNRNDDFGGNGSLQINQEASSFATEVIHKHSPAAIIKSEHSTDRDTDTPLQIRSENIMSLAACQGDLEQCVQDNATGTIAGTESSTTETGSKTTENQFKTEGSSNFSFLLVVKGCFLCLLCQTKWNTDFDSFFKHVWEKHTHGEDFSCCPTGYSPYCARLEAVVKTIYDKSQVTMTDQIRSYFTPKSPIKTENENVQNISSSESSSSAPVPSRVETVKQVNVNGHPSTTVPVRPSSATRKCEKIVSADFVSRSNESSSPPTTLVADQQSHMIENEQNYDFDAVTENAGNELGKGTQYVQESAIQIRNNSKQIGNERGDEENICSTSELRDLNLNYQVLQNITEFDQSISVASSSVSEESNNTTTYEDISFDDRGGINFHNRGTGSINYSLADGSYSDELPLDLSKKTIQPEKSHNSLTVTPMLAAEMATVNSVTNPERVSSSRNSFIITPLSLSETAVTSSITQTAVTSSITRIEGPFPDSIGNAHDSVTSSPLPATETVTNPTTLPERLNTNSAANTDTDFVSQFACSMGQSECTDLDQIGLHLQESLLKAIKCKHCASFFLNIFSWTKHMAVEHVDLPPMDCMTRKRLCYERKFPINVPHQSSQEDITCPSNVERGAQTSDYQHGDTRQESHASHGTTANVLEDVEIISSHVTEHSEVRSKDFELPERHSHGEVRDMADGIEAKTTHEHISKINKLLDLKTSAAMRSWISVVSSNARKAEQSAVAITGPNSNESRGNCTAQQCESGACTSTVIERSCSVDIDLHGLMRPDSSRGNNKLSEAAQDVTAIKASMGGNDGFIQIENSYKVEEYFQPDFKTSTSDDNSNSVKSALSYAEDNTTNTLLDYEDHCCQGVAVEIQLGMQSTSYDNLCQTVSESISTLPYNLTVPLTNHCLNEKAELSVVGQADAASQIRHSTVKQASPSVVGNTDASVDTDRATAVDSLDGCCDVTFVSSGNTESCKTAQASDCSDGSNAYFNITPTALSLPATRVSDFAGTSAANFNLGLVETRTILCAPEHDKLEYTENTCLPVEDNGADIDNRQESRHPSVVLENKLKSGVQHDIEHGISNVVKDGGDQASSAAVAGKSVSRTVFLSSHSSTVGRNNIKEHQQTDVLPSCNINPARTDSFVSVPSITDESILSVQLDNRQKLTRRSIVQQTVKGASVINQNCESAHDSDTKMNYLFKEPCTDNRSHCAPDMIIILKTVSHDSDDNANLATNSLNTNLTSQSYTELNQHVRSRHSRDMSTRFCRVLSRSLKNAAEQSERWQDATKSLQEVQNTDVTMSHVHDEITTPHSTGCHSETGIGYRATVNKSKANSQSSHKTQKERDLGSYKCLRPKCTFTCNWNTEKMTAHIKRKHPYYSCGYCKAPYTTLAYLYKHFEFVHRSKKPIVMDDTITLGLLFSRVDIPCNELGAACKDVTSQTPAKRKKLSQSSVIDDVKKSEAKASSGLKILKRKRRTPVKSCDVNVTSNQQNQPLGDFNIEKTSKDNDSHSVASLGLKTPQCKLRHSKSEGILGQIPKEMSSVPEREVSSAEKATVTSKTAAISNNGYSRSANTGRNLINRTMRSTFAKTIDHTHRIPTTVSLHTKKPVTPSATLLLSPRSADHNIRRNKVTDYHELQRHSSAQSVCSKLRRLGPVSFQDTVRKVNSSVATYNHTDLNVSFNSVTSVQSSSTVRKQELNSVDISDKQESSNRLGNVHETLPEICSETASRVSDTVLLPHTTKVASAIVTSLTQDQKHCETFETSQLGAKITTEGNENKVFVPKDLRTHSVSNLSLHNESKAQPTCENAATTDEKAHTIKPLSKHDYPFRCAACSRILKCVKAVEKHYNTDHPTLDVRLTERKSGFVYSNSGKCLHWKDKFKTPTDSYLCSYCAFRSMTRSDVEGHIRLVHAKREVRVFTLCKPNTDRYSTRSKVTALPHEASSSNSPASSYFCSVCSDVKNSEFQFRLHLASHRCFKHTTQLTAGASFLCHTCGYIAESRGDFVQHTGEHVSERRFQCFVCEYDSHHKKSVRVRIKSVHSKTVDDDIGIIDRNKPRNVDLRPRLVNIDPQVVLTDPFRHPNYLQQLLLEYGIKSLNLTD